MYLPVLTVFIIGVKKRGVDLGLDYHSTVIGALKSEVKKSDFDKYYP